MATPTIKDRRRALAIIAAEQLEDFTTRELAEYLEEDNIIPSTEDELHLEELNQYISEDEKRGLFVVWYVAGNVTFMLREDAEAYVTDHLDEIIKNVLN